jgi:hypothetical protein
VSVDIVGAVSTLVAVMVVVSMATIVETAAVSTSSSRLSTPALLRYAFKRIIATEKTLLCRY